MRASLKHASEEDARLKAYDRSNNFGGNRKALGRLRRIVEESLDFEWTGQAWDHDNNRRHMWQSDASKEAFTFGGDQLPLAADLIEAEFEVSRILMLPRSKLTFLKC